MKLAPLRFGGMSLHHNPEKLVIADKNHIHQYHSPCCTADSESLGRELKVITGEGELYGQDCLTQYEQLLRMQACQTRSKLVLPKMQPMYAYLRELSLTAQPVEDVLRYRFVFVEAQSPRQSTQPVTYLTAVEGDSLWDIAYACHVPVERLMALNPHIPFINELNEGGRVRIC